MKTTTIPTEALQQHGVVLGKTGAGKSYALRGLVEIGFLEHLRFPKIKTHDSFAAPTHGHAALPDAQPLPTGLELQAFHLARLPQGEKAVLEMAISHYPEWLDRADIDTATGYKRSSRDAYIHRLVAKQLLEVERGLIRASETLF